MVPPAFVLLDALPLTPNGKVDRKALAGLAPSREPAGEVSPAPRTATEELIAVIWEDVLRLERVGVNDSFFDLGGHSLLGTQLVSRVREVFQVALPMRSLFEAPTVAGLAARVEAARRTPLVPVSPIAVVSRDRDLPASYAQERLWFLEQLGGEGTSYVLPLPLRLRGPLMVPALAAALGTLADRHESLRTTFDQAEDGTVVQRITPAAGLPLLAVDLTAAPDPEAEALKVARDEARLLFDLKTGPLARATLLRLDEEHHVLLLTMHHIISDGWSLRVLVHELKALYEAFAAGRPSPLPGLPVQYADFAAWQRGWLTDELLDSEIAWWRERLAGSPAVLDLPTDRPRPAVRTPRGDVVGMVLPRQLADDLDSLARRAGATSFMTLLAAFQVLLRRYTGRDDLPVGTPIANRNRTEIEGLIGFFVNTLVMRGDLSGQPTFLEALKRTRDSALASYDHQDLPFEKLVEALQPERSLAHTLIFQVMFLLQADPLEAAAGTAGPTGTTGSTGLELGVLGLTGDSAKVDLTLAVSPTEDGLAVKAEYSRDLFDAPTVLRLLEHFRVLLEGIADDPGRRIDELPLLTRPERHALLFEENDTAAGVPDRSVPELFEEQVRRTPDRVAVSCEGESLTYAELNARANRIAHRLRRLGAGPEVRVGVSLERSLDLVAGLLGILKAGAAYLPLDPALPAERLAFLIADAGITLVLNPEEVQASLTESDADPESSAGPRSLAYVLYTSGSTGVPKGVEVEHRSIVRLVRGANFADLGEAETFLQLAPVPFDASTLEIWAPLLNGGRLVVFPPHTPSLEELGCTLSSEGISTLWLTAGLFHQMVEAQPESLRGVRQLLAGGDALSVPHVQRVLERLEPGHRLVNGYGPTENTTFTCCWVMDTIRQPGSSVPIGRPVSNTRVHLLGRDLEPVPLGVPGALYAAGDGMARGYLGRPELTAERFVPSPLPVFSGERLYRTGDLARRLPSGEIEFLGRLDNQVKLRGFRIELGEIEAAVCGHPAVREAAVLVREDQPGDKRLVAYVAGEEAIPPTPELRAFLSRKLPDYMIPAAFVVLETLPLTPNGKVDRRALAAVEPGRLETLSAEQAAPRDEIEELIAGIWCQVLGLEAIGVHDDFFELGGHSLLATRVVSKVREVLGAELPLRVMFEAPTVAGVSERLRRERTSVTSAPIVPLPREGRPPASFAQERLWFLDQLGDDCAAYNVPAALALRGALAPAALEAAVNEVVRRHEVLRTTFAEPFAEEPGRVVQVIAPSLRLSLPEVDLRLATEPSREARRLAREEGLRLFDLRTGPLLRVALLRLRDDERWLLLTQHHIASDGWSIGILLRELSTLYDAFAAGRPSPLPELPVQYADFAAWQREHLAGDALEAQLAWWRERLESAPPALELPADRPRPAVLSPRGGLRSASLPLDLTDALQALARRRGATPFMVLLAAFQALLGRVTGREDLTVGSPVANRNRAETEALLGFFVNTLVLRADLSGDPSFAGLLERVRESALGAYAHQDVPFERLVADLHPERDLSHTPLFQVMLIVQNLPSGTRAGWALVPPEEGEGTAKFNLTLSFGASGGRWIAQAEYRRTLFDPPTIDRLLGGLTRLLTVAVAEPVTRVADLPLMDETELHQVLAEWNDTVPLAVPALCLHEHFEAQADMTPEAEALVAGTERLTYAELDRRANRLAHWLRRRGVGPEARVGIALERTADLPVALLAVLKAGGAYVPLDPAYPRERLDLILEDAGCAVVVTPESLLDLDLEDDSRLPGTASPGNLAYLIYTSGSTGRPKGVAIEHRSADALIRWAGEVFEDLSGVLASTSITFDLSVFELFLPLACGGRVILAANALALPDLPARDEVRLINTVPSAIAELVRLGAVPESVRTVNLAGEPLKRALVDRIYALPHIEAVYNLYGPSEDTTYSTWVRVPRNIKREDREPTIGVPIAGTRACVVDRGLRPLPPGVPGELCLAGEGLARGYLNRPDLTAASFVPDPFGGFGERMYRTGDLARRLPGGELEFLGRIDHQVKVRGFRIELGEIESALLAVVREAVVLALGEGGERKLVAYVSGETGPAELRSWLESRLPAYMVPSAFVVLDALPLTPNGKVDRKALAHIEPERESLPSAGLLTPVEELLAGIWTEVLRCGPIGPEDRFFDLGGHSLLATQVVSRAREVFGIELPLRVLFEAPSLSVLAARIETLRNEGLGLDAPPILPLHWDGRAPASFAQERLWFLEQLGDEPGAYNIPLALSLRGSLDPAALEAALNEVVRRHEVLRTTFASEGRSVVQKIAPSLRVPLPVIEIGEDSAETRRLAREEATRPFDLSTGPLLRTVLLRLGLEEHVLLLTMHHIVSDGWSIGVLLRELSTLHDGGSLPALPVQYADFAAWQQEWLSGDVLEAQLAWWRERLAGAPAVLELPADRPRPAVRSPRGGHRSAWLSAELSDGLAALARGQGATPFMVLLSAFQALLGRLTGQTDLSVGSPVANRNRAETEGLIGFFVNTLILRGDLAGDPSFAELLARSRETALDAYAHQDLPFEKLVAEVRPERELSHSPLFQVMLIVQNLPGAVREGWMLMPGPDEDGTAKFDLTLTFGASGGRLLAQAEYRRDLFEGATVDRLLGWLETLLQGAISAITEPGGRISGLPLLTEPERCQVLEAWNDTGSLRPEVCLHERFEAQAELTPEAEALIWGEERISYAELDRRANRLARRLRRLGVGPEARVGIALERSADLVVGLLAVLKAGGVYVPLDPAYPPERLALIQEDAGCAVVVDREILLDAEMEDDGRLPGLASPGDLAYLIYTSGSTGRPKGVAIEHRSAAALLAWAEREFGAEELSGVLASTSITFDLSVFELFLPLARGGRVIVAGNALSLPDLPARDEVTLINTVPSAIAELVRLGAVPESVRTVNLAGEPLKRALVDRIYALPHVERVYNLYGPSEDTTYSTFVLVPRATDREPTIGVPIAGTRAYVVDRGLRPLPVGVPGELLLAGEGLARGYLNRPDLTAASFVPDPFGGAGERVYRTGDLARWNGAGELEFLGRIDHQVKVRGFRVELGEIEVALCAHAAVREAVVLALGEGGERRLVAFVAPHPSGERALPTGDGGLPIGDRGLPIGDRALPAGERGLPAGETALPSGDKALPDGDRGLPRGERPLPVGETGLPVGERALPRVLRVWLESRLPAYMVPSSFAVLPALPLTPNGKVDRKALARVEPEREPAAAAAPLSPVEELLAGIWSEVLRRGPVASGDGFFELGGHSLLATQVVSRVREVFGVELPLRAVFEAPTLAGLAARIGAARNDLQAPPVVPVPRDGELRASFAQERLWFLDRFGTDRASYNLPTAIRLRGRLDTAALAGALKEIVRRHESLRTTFTVTGGAEARVLQVIGPACLSLPVVDLRGLPEPENEVTRLAREDARRPFDLSRGPLLRTALLQAAEEDHTLLLSMHHIVSDGWSIGVLLGELTALYRRSPLADLPVQYADFAAWQRTWLRGEVLERQLGWWRDHLAGVPPVLDLPADRPRPPVPSGRGGRFPVALSSTLREGIQKLARQQGATSFMVLLAAFQTLLGRLASRDDVPVGTPIAGRIRAETERLIGFFVNTLVLRADLAGDPAFRGLLGRTREALLGAYAHQDLPFEKLVEELHPERSQAHSPLFQVMLILQNAPMDDLELPGVTATPAVPDTGTTKFDLRLALSETAEGLVGSVLYNLDLFDAATARRMAGHFQALLAAAVVDPEARLSDLPVLGQAEVQHLLREWNDTRVDWDLERPLHGWIEDQVRRTPDAPALTYEGETLTYRELDERAGRLAARLRRQGAGPETRIGITAERSLELVVGLLGILKSGACYVPIDPSYPPERLAFMVEDFQQGIEQPILLTRESLADAPEPEAPRSAVLPKHPAYVIYTSGSTGRPKGAVNTHEAIVNRLVWMQAEYGLTSGDVVLQKTPFSFDVSVWEFFWPLMVGARLVVARPGGHQDSAYLADLIRREGVTTLHFVPSMLQVFLEQPGVETCASLRRVICSGEALPFELQQRFFAKLGAFAGLHNLYGPTEAAVDVTVWACVPGGRPVVPIGRPISNLRIHILDPAFRPVPMNVPGELYIAGVGLARGYLNRPALTADRFVPDPFGSPGSRMYKSGDLCRHLPDGRIEYLGRLDHQVKIRGFRIELGEIEAALCAHPTVKEAVVLAREDRPGDKRLVAYLTAAGETVETAVPELRRHLLASLPEYMVPAAFVVLPALPLSPNGKVDRKLLPAPDIADTAAPEDREHVAPRTPLEEFLAGLWKAPLGLESVGIHDDFFGLGGNSISGAILINQLQERLGEIVHVVVIFDAPTVERMAAYLVESYPEAVARIWGRESLGEAVALLDEAAAGRVGEEEIARLRAIVTPLSPFATDEPKNPPAVFVLSPPRSGSTLLRVMLAGHPRLFAPPELEMLNFNALADRRAAYTGRDSFSLEGLIRAVMEVRGCGPDEAAETVETWERDGWTVRRAYRQLQEWLGDRLLIDKTPSYPLDLEILRRAETDFEGARYVHLLRHPYGMIRSFEEARLEQVFFRYDHPFTRRELAELIWLVSQENILRFLDGVPEERRHLVRFEDLVRDPEPVLRGLCDFLGLDFHPAMLQPYEDRSRRMTDGLHAESRMLGDVKFHSYSGIDASTAERWREAYPEDFLGVPTVRMAAALGYEVRAGRGSMGGIPRRSWKPDEPRPLSFSQERLWFLGQFDPDSSFYNISSVLRFAGRLDVSALGRSLDEIRRRHEVLRTVFETSSAGTFQVVTAPPAVGLPVIDLSGLPDGARERETSRVARAEGGRSFDLAADSMLRTPLLKLGEDHALVVAMHHIASDGWSMGVILSELSDLYEAFGRGLPSPLPELPIQYGDFAVWQRNRLSGEVLDREIAWWGEALAGAPTLIQLPTDRPRPAVQRFRGGQVEGFLPDDLAAGVAALGRRHGATSFMSLVAAFQALLSRISGSPEVVVGTPIAGRNWPETEGLVGFFINTLVVRGDVTGDPTYRELVARSRRAALGAFAHQEVPFEKLVEELQPQRSLTHSPIFQVMFALQNLPPRRFDLPGLEITAYRTGGGTSKFDLNLLLTEIDGRLLGTLEYNSDLFDRSTAQRLLGSFETLLRGLVTDPDRRLSDISLIAEAGRHQMLCEWNDTEAPFPGHLCLHQPFEAWAAAQPDAVAVLCDGRTLTYDELDRRANRLARLLRSQGVGPGRLVAVHLERSPEMIVAVLGIHKAGGAYVPVEVSWPADRLRYILESERIAHVVTEPSRLEALPSGVRAICPDDLEGLPDHALEPTAGPEDPAYIIFTSGSTGRPKGVVVRHRPAVNLIHWVNNRFGVGPSDTLLFVTALSFDLSVYDIFGLLAAGGTVRIATPAELRDPEALVRILLEEPVTFWDSAPAALQQLVSWLPADAQPASLRLVFNSGDWIPVTLPDRVRQTFPNVEFVSLGGATEATIWSNFFPVEEVEPDWASIPYGRPIENARYHVLEAGLSPCPVGVAGDLYIGGGCLSDGYASAPDLTAQKYIPDPFGEGRLYRTGDRARYWPDGNLEFLGRVDNQVKVRGFRIELGEIESVLMTHPAVREAVVLARQDTPGDQRLVAYLIPDGEAPAAIELRRFVQGKLPDYMVPSSFIPLESWPLAATGKLDRKALSPPEKAFAKPEIEAPVLPRNEMERTIAEIWKEVVGLPEVGIRDNFFDVGGHSLLMARVHARLEETLGLRVSMVDLFQYPTIATLAAHLSPSVEEKPAVVTAPVVERGSEDIAVIGLAGRFPGARNVEELWRNLRDEVESIRGFTEQELRAGGYGDEVLDPRFVRRRGALDGPDLFDAAFFEYSSREAQLIDPQQRHFLECAWEALENAGYGADGYRQRVGVFAGTTENTYVLNLLLNADLLRSVGRQQVTISNNADYLPTRVSYKLNLRGPSLNVQTACSTSLVAVHLARLSLLRGECEIALAGGVSVKPLEVGGYLYHEGGINSPDGHTRAFDARAQGVVGGSGAGVVVLKRLEDALADGDTIHAVIRGSAVNNDGSGKPGFTAPSVEGQAAAIREAHRAAGIEPGTIGYVEAHGTGTPMGDPIEAAALIQAFGDTGKPGACALGSIKTNIGHLDAAAGVAGLIKTVLSLENRTIPASLHFEQPNPKIPFEGSPFYVAARTREWPADGTPRRAGVSSFGIGGTNAHAVLEEAPEIPAGEPSRRPSRLLVLSAKTPTALETATANLAGWLEAHPEASLDDAAFTLQVGRQAFRHRRAMVCGEDAIAALRDIEGAVTGSAAGSPSVVFLFPGQGSQYAGMGAELYEHEPVYRSAFDRCCELLDLDLRDALEDADLAQTSITQPALFAVEYSLARLWASWGIRPAAMLGHSIGEYVAACLAGVFSLEEALFLVAARGRLMQELPPGSMLGVSLSGDEVRSWIEGRDLSLAAVNAPRACVVSGPEEEIEALRKELETQGVETRPLHTSHAFHSRMMDPILEPFLEKVRSVRLQPPRLRYLSNLTGTWITPEQATDPEYWVEHLRQAVRFADGVSELLRLPDPVLLEAGPGRALSTLARQHPDKKAARLVVSSLSHAKDRKPDLETVLGALGRLWVHGVDVDWNGYRADERRRRIPLPTYPFERRSYWIGFDRGLGARFGKTAPAAEVPVEETPELVVPAGKTGPRNETEEAIVAVWSDLLGEDGIGVHDDFFELGGSSLMAVQLGARLRQALSIELPVDFLFQAPTVAGVAEMVARIRPKAGRPAERLRSSCLVPLQKGDGRRPLFLVHQVGGNVYTFRALAQALGKSQTVYGLRSLGLEDGEEPLASVEEMATHYLELARSAQPAGPYRIGGASMGGMVAFEMAHRLREAGETVELLTLMDTPCGEQMPQRRLTSEEIVTGAFTGRIELTPEELQTLSPDGQISYAIDKARQAGALSEDFDEGGARRIVRVLQSNVAALYAYQPRPFAGRMLFFRAGERRPGDPPRPEIAWIDLAQGGCDVLLVTGNHETMHETPNVLSMAERLRESLLS